MKFNPECVKSILITIEEKADGINYVTFPQDFTFDCFTVTESRYHIQQCRANGLLEIKSEDLSGNVFFADLTPKGHTILSEMRKPGYIDFLKKTAHTTCNALISALLQNIGK